MKRLARRLRHGPTWLTTGLLVAALATGALLEPPARMALWSLIGIFALYLGCVMVVRFDELTSFYRFTGWAFFYSMLLNLAWELWHSVYFMHFTESGNLYPALVRMLFGAATADGVVALGLFFALTLARKGEWDWPWPPPWRYVAFVLVLATAVQVGVEIGAVATGMWAYNDNMPVIPLLNVGLTPVLQMPVLIMPIFWLSQRMLCADPHELALRRQRLARGE